MILTNSDSAARSVLRATALGLAISLCVFGAFLEPASQSPLRLVVLWTLAAVLLIAGAGLPEPAVAQPPDEIRPAPFPWAKEATVLGCAL
jgi:hypothetical protein